LNAEKENFTITLPAETTTAGIMSAPWREDVMSPMPRNLNPLGNFADDLSLTSCPASAAPSEESTPTRPQSVVQGILGPSGETLTHESFSVTINEAIERVRAEYKEELRQLKL
jgi:hypothetical protein